MTVNTNKNTQNQKVVINLSTSSLHEHHKRKPVKEKAAPAPAPVPVGIHNVYQPQQSLISQPHADIPSYFSSALTNRDLALNALRDAAVAQDEHHAMRNAYAMGTVPGGIPAHVPDEAAAPVPPPQPEPVHAEPVRPPEHEPEIVPEPVQEHAPAPVPHEEPVMNNNPAYEAPHAPAPLPAIDYEPQGRGVIRRREEANAEDGYDPEITHISELHDRFNSGTLYRKTAIRGEIVLLARRYGLPIEISPENSRSRNTHQLVHDIKMHIRNKRQEEARGRAARQ
jgi:hypothetical protein